MDSPLKIAVDFDGTIVEHKYPEIGKEVIFALRTLRALNEQGHQLILWTYRSGKELDDAVEYCRRNGVEFYAINSSYPEEEFDEDYDSRKIDADIFIDDRNIGGLLSWGEIYQIINPDEKPTLEEEIKSLSQNKRSLLKKLTGR